MGLSRHKPLLPAPTESLIESNAEETGVSEDIGTDLSRRTDRTSATIPDDGSPVTITTGQKAKSHKLAKASNPSQTSLLIEYYEGVKDPDTGRRPSLRVRVRPSAGGKSKEIKGDGHIVLTQQQGSRTASYSRRIPLTSRTLHTQEDTASVDSGEDLDATPTGRGPIDIEIGDGGSDLSKMSASPEPRFNVLESDISSMPADSMLGTRAPEIISAPPAASSIITNSDLHNSNELKPPVFPRERNLSHERLTQKAIEKISNKERAPSKSSRHHSDKSRSRGTSIDIIGAPVAERRRKSTKHYGEESSVSTMTDPSQISNSLLSAGGRSADQQSVRSGVSNITNPKLLQTVEDAIRRLILPELKEIKRNGSQRTRHKEEDPYSDVSESSIVREKEASRRVSSGSKSRRRTSKESGGPTSRRRERSYKSLEPDSASDISSPVRESVSSTSEHYHRSSTNDHRLRDVAAGTLAGTALTAAALHHQDSSSTLDRRQRRKRSKSRGSRSRSVSVNESEEIFDKHEVPPMPFRSEVGSEITRSSLLSSNTASTATPTQREVREVIRGSPLTDHSTGSETPTRGAGNLKTLGTHHKNFSEHDLTVNRPMYDDQVESVGSPETRGYSPEMEREQSYSSGLLADPERIKLYERNLHQQHPIRRGLSPIQSVASYQTTEPNRNSMMYARSVDSIASMKKRQQALREEVSIDSFSSASPDLKNKGRPQGINLENRSEILQQHDDRLDEHDDEEDEEFYDEQHSQNDRYRESYASEDYKTGVHHRLTTYADDGLDTPHIDKITAGQHVARGFEANPEYVHTPPGVESAVASLIEPSLLDVPGSSRHSVSDVQHDDMHGHATTRDIETMKSHSPLKEQSPILSYGSVGKTRQYDDSPPQSPARSFDENQEEHLNVASTEQKAATSPESEITTNPSVIQGPIGGLTSTTREHWPYAPTPDRAMPNYPAQQALNRDLAMHAPDLIPEALNVNQRATFVPKSDMYTNVVTSPTPPHIKDEGYATGDNPRSPGLYAKQNERAYTPDDMKVQEDPFVAKRDQYVSGLSQGMSPMYDAATGRGIDRIQSKDIVALMDHLTVRDAQRNARDTEILITLVRSAAEMRNSFEDMKKFIAEQDGIIMDVAEQQHEKTQKVIGGPRPQPASRTQQRSVASQDDFPAKRRNIFQRALQGLGSKNAVELQNIEQMLMQLLDDVEELRVVQGVHGGNLATSMEGGRSVSAHSGENARAATDPGYEPEGQAGTSSTGDRSGFFSGNSSRQTGQTDQRVTSGRRQSSNRVSTVMEGSEDEHFNDYDEDPNNQLNPQANPATEAQYRNSRGQSAPAESPPKMHQRLSGPWSHDAGPQYPAEPLSAGRKHKSIASSIFGKAFISRWSKTTASTAQEPRYSDAAKNRPYSQLSRSGSDLGEYAYEAQPDDRLRSNTSLQNEQYRDQENRPPSPLVPSQVSENPKYQGYRNSQNLQHPQPRQGPTGRYQYRLESEAQTYDDHFSPTSQTSSHWENQPTMNPQTSQTTSHYIPQAPLSPISDGGYSERSNSSGRRGPQRPPKVADDEPLVPQRPAKVPMSPSTYVDHVAAARSGSPAYDQSPAAALRSPQGSNRKPSGPRPLSSTGQNGKVIKGDLNSIKKTRFRGSPYQIEN